MVEVADPGKPSEAGRLQQKSADAFAAGELDKAQRLAGDSVLASAYTHLQQIVGVMAFLLAPVLFVGVLWALAVFFLSYNYKPLPGFNLDNKLSTLAAIAAVSVAVFPTTSDASVPTRSEHNIGIVHGISAGVLFVLLAVFALFLFPRGSGATTLEKQRRNVVYRTCGGIMVIAILLMVVWRDPPDSWHVFLALETICVVAFGVSWLVKGGFLGILADKKPTPAPAPT